MELKKPYKLHEDLVKFLCERISDEYSAFFFYRSAAAWAKMNSWKNLANFLESEAKDELKHAKKIENFLSEWDSFTGFYTPKCEYKFENIVDVVNQAYEIEWLLLQTYMIGSKSAYGKDMNVFFFLKNYIEIQNLEVTEWADKLNALANIDFEDRLSILYFEENYFKK